VLEVGESVVEQRGANAFGKIDSEVLVVDRGEDAGGELAGMEKMGEIGTAVVLAGVAVAASVNR